MNEYLDLVREQQNLWNMKMTEIPTIIEALEALPKNLEKYCLNGI